MFTLPFSPDKAVAGGHEIRTLDIDAGDMP